MTINQLRKVLDILVREGVDPDDRVFDAEHDVLFIQATEAQFAKVEEEMGDDGGWHWEEQFDCMGWFT